VKEVQWLMGCMAALSRFLLASGDKGYPYFQCLKKNNRFVWTRTTKKRVYSGGYNMAVIKNRHN